MYKSYSYFEKRYPNTVIFQKEGYFYGVRKESAIVLSNVCNLNLFKRENDVYETGVPEYSLGKYLDELEVYNIDYVVINGEKIYDRRDFEYNNFTKHLKYPSESYFISNETDNNINVDDEVTIKLIETEEVFTLKVVPAYKKYEYNSMGGAYYGASTRIVDDSDADISQGTINIDAPIIKHLRGINENEFFEVKVGDISTQYQLLSLKKTYINNDKQKHKQKESPVSESTNEQNHNKRYEQYEQIELNIEGKNHEINRNDKKLMISIPLEISFEYIRVVNQNIEFFLDTYRDNVIILVNGSVNINSEEGTVKYVLQYREHKRYFEGSLKTRSVNRTMLWGISHAVKRINKKTDIVIVIPVALGFKKALRGKGPNAKIIMEIIETLEKLGCNLTVVHWYKGSKSIESYLINPR